MWLTGDRLAALAPTNCPPKADVPTPPEIMGIPTVRTPPTATGVPKPETLDTGLP